MHFALSQPVMPNPSPDGFGLTQKLCGDGEIHRTCQRHLPTVFANGTPSEPSEPLEYLRFYQSYDFFRCFDRPVLWLDVSSSSLDEARDERDLEALDKPDT